MIDEDLGSISFAFILISGLVTKFMVCDVNTSDFLTQTSRLIKLARQLTNETVLISKNWEK